MNKKTVVVIIIILGQISLNPCSGAVGHTDIPGIKSFDTGYTICKVRTAFRETKPYIIASSYEGTVLQIGYDGSLQWANSLSGFMNHDLWCEDINNDGSDEIFAANADGTLYCLDSEGQLKWKFKPTDAPMNAVCVMYSENEPYIVCGGYDKSIYYLSSKGELIKEIPSSTYSKEKAWGENHRPPNNQHTANFLRRVRQAKGSDLLAVHGVINGNAASGSIYLFAPLAEKPHKLIKCKGGPVGEFRSCDVDHDGVDEILMGSSSMIQSAVVVRSKLDDSESMILNISKLKNLDRFGYRVVQPEIVMDGKTEKLFVLFGSRIILMPTSMDGQEAEVLTCHYSFNDMWKDGDGRKIILASAQSGGSCIHVLDMINPRWKKDYSELQPEGNIQSILDNTEIVRNNLKNYKRPVWERKPLPVYFLSESIPKSVKPLVDEIKTNYDSPMFLNSIWMPAAENWDRSEMTNQKYRNRRDRRKPYTLTRQQVLDKIVPRYNNAPGLAYWGGHGNDPYFYHIDTTRQILNSANGKKTVLIFPELEDHSQEFSFVLNDLIYPLAAHCRKTNANIFVRTKHTFWQSTIYLPMWSRLMSGEYADVFVPSMEETTDKSMELSVAARMGVWASGATDSWGARCARDNPSFNRLRQHSHQMLPNHFLRAMVYNISCGAQYLDNFPVNQEYMSLLWELIAKGALYVPKRSEIVSFSPVHLSIVEPVKRYIEEGNNCKWTTFYDKKFEENNPFVFSHLNGTWPGAPVTDWDFSRYAAGVKDRRLNFLPYYHNGLVLITPPQQGVFADNKAPRGAMSEKLHPVYKDILKEYITNGRHYLSSDGKQRYEANQYYKTIEADIQNCAKKLPLTVSGNVAWVAAQSSPTHLRLTLIDSGYINPKATTATVKFQTVQPKKVVDILDDKVFPVSQSSVQIDIPCGMFRLIDIELSKAFQVNKI